MTTDPMFANVDKRKSDKTNLKELRETFKALQLKYERDTHELRTKVLDVTAIAMQAEVDRDIAKDDVEWLEQRVSELEANAARYNYIRDNHQWRRSGEGPGDPDYHAFVGVKFPYEADFSCAAMLDYNIDKAIKDV